MGLQKKHCFRNYLNTNSFNHFEYAVKALNILDIVNLPKATKRFQKMLSAQSLNISKGQT